MLVDDNSTDRNGAANVVELFFDLIRCGMGKCDCLSRVPGALVYVMQKVFGLEEKYAFVKPNVRLGEFLLSEVMIAGNFGKYDHRYNLGEQEYTFRRTTETLRRNMMLITRFPSEILWSPYFKAWHYFWRKRH